MSIVSVISGMSETNLLLGFSAVSAVLGVGLNSATPIGANVRYRVGDALVAIACVCVVLAILK